MALHVRIQDRHPACQAQPQKERCHMFVCIYLYCLHEASSAVTFSSCAHEAWAIEEMSPVMLGNMR